MKQHVHAEFIKAWADGAEIEFYDPFREVYIKVNGVPQWDERVLYRIKPPADIVLFSIARPIATIGEYKVAGISDAFPVAAGCNLKLTYDAQTLALKHAEVV